MEKLELKHLVGYLPYELKGFNQNDRIVYFTLSDGRYLLDRKFKPILRPLSELTKEDINSFSVDVRLALRELNSEKLLSRACYYELQWLLENHYDIHNLIENNLAIDINTLNK